MKSIAELFFVRPWAIKEDILSIMSKVVIRHMSGERLPEHEIDAVVRKENKGRPGYQVAGSVARIPVQGIIAKRSSMVNGTSQPEGTSTEQIREELNAALADEKIQTIVLDIDSPGGSASGVAELSDAIYAARKQKKIYAYANGLMCSAGYWIGSAAEKVFATRSTEVGSIGVYSTYYDVSVANHNQGIKTTIIKAGENKVAGHPDVPMTENDRKIIQEEVNAYYDLFVSSVARNRGISQAQALQLADGKVYIGQKALELGLIDGIEELSAAFSGVQSGQAQATANGADAGVQVVKQTGELAGIENVKTEEIEMDLSKLTTEELKVARPDLCVGLVAEGHTAGISEGRAAAEAEAKASAEAEKVRVAGILESAAQIHDVDAVALKCVKDGLSIADSEKTMKAAKLDAMSKAAPEAMGAGNPDQASSSAASLPLEEQCEKLWTSDPNIRSEFKTKDIFYAFMKAEKAGKVGIFKGAGSKS